MSLAGDPLACTAAAAGQGEVHQLKLGEEDAGGDAHLARKPGQRWKTPPSAAHLTWSAGLGERWAAAALGCPCAGLAT